MFQLNINITPDFRKDLRSYMKIRKLSQKSEAIRRALHEAVERIQRKKPFVDFRSWLGFALKSPLQPHPRFRTEDDLWNK